MNYTSNAMAAKVSWSKVCDCRWGFDENIHKQNEVLVIYQSDAAESCQSQQILLLEAKLISKQESLITTS